MASKPKGFTLIGGFVQRAPLALRLRLVGFLSSWILGWALNSLLRRG